VYVFFNRILIRERTKKKVRKCSPSINISKQNRSKYFPVTTAVPYITDRRKRKKMPLFFLHLDECPVHIKKTKEKRKK